MIRRSVLVLLILGLLLAAGFMTALFIFRYPTPAQFSQAERRRPVAFPRDEAAHFNMQTEWWYYTGFLRGAEGRQYGFELVFFKTFLPRQVRVGNVLPIHLTSNPFYFAHLAVSDPAVRDHQFFVQANFPQFWSAGADEERYRVWNGDWQAWGSGSEHHLTAAGGPYALRLDLQSADPPALHGPEGTGIVAMGRAGTTYYYSYPDLRGVGVLTVGGAAQGVQAEAWMDHQWGSWTQHGQFAGWDWFSLRLDDGNRVMLFGFRDADGRFQAESSGTWIGADGTVQHLASDRFNVQVLDRWPSPHTGALYPVRWRVQVPDRHFTAEVEAAFPEQEMATGFGPTYWEGMVTISGTPGGVGFVEMTGYDPGGSR